MIGQLDEYGNLMDCSGHFDIVRVRKTFFRFEEPTMSHEQLLWESPLPVPCVCYRLWRWPPPAT